MAGSKGFRRTAAAVLAMSPADLIAEFVQTAAITSGTGTHGHKHEITFALVSAEIQNYREQLREEINRRFDQNFERASDEE